MSTPSDVGIRPSIGGHDRDRRTGLTDCFSNEHVRGWFDADDSAVVITDA